MGLDPAYERRLENVRTLLRTLNDVYPGPQSVKATDLPGPAPSSRVPCRLCNPSSVQPRKKITGCLGCDGDGWRRARKGEAVYDEYTGRPVATLQEPKKAVPMSPARLEAEIARTRRVLMAHDGAIDPYEAEAWERARERRDRGTSYRELERVLDLLQIERPLWRSYITWAYFTGVGRPTALDRRVVTWIADRMQGHVRIPHDLYLAQLQRLKDECRRLLKAGESEDSVKSLLGVSTRFIRAEAAATLRVSVGPSAGNA